ASRPTPKTAASPSGGSGYWNWVKPESVATKTDAQAEVGVDLSGLVGDGAREVKLFIQCDFDENAGSSHQHWFYLYFKAPSVSADFTGFYMLVDGGQDLGASSTFDLPLDGTGFRYYSTAQKATGGSLV